jgi:hypothetical protein
MESSSLLSGNEKLLKEVKNIEQITYADEGIIEIEVYDPIENKYTKKYFRMDEKKKKNNID